MVTMHPGRFQADGIELLAAPHFGRLQADGIELLAASDALRNLTAFGLSRNRIGPEGVRRLSARRGCQVCFAPSVR